MTRFLYLLQPSMRLHSGRHLRSMLFQHFCYGMTPLCLHIFALACRRGCNAADRALLVQPCIKADRCSCKHTSYKASGATQIGEQETFISELLNELTGTIQDLETHQIHMFYEAVGLMIGADATREKQDHYLVSHYVVNTNNNNTSTNDYSENENENENDIDDDDGNDNDNDNNNDDDDGGDSDDGDTNNRDSSSKNNHI